MALQKPVRTVDPPRERVGDSADVGPKKFPTLGSYMGDTVWADGSPRITSTMLIFQEDGVWKCCFTDRDGARNAWVSAQSLGGLFESLERGLAEERLDWRRKAVQAARKGR